MTSELGLAREVDGVLHMEEGHKDVKITLTLNFVRNKSSKEWTFKEKRRAKHFDFDKLEAFFNQHVTVNFIDSSNWTPCWSDGRP